MNGRSLAAFICSLFVIGIVWMIAGIPKGATSKSSAKLFQPIIPVSPPPGETSEQKLTAREGEQKPEESAEVPKTRQPESEETQKGSAKTETGEPPNIVTYSSDFGRVTFSHTKHVEDYGIVCGSCHHEDRKGGMAKCTHCHKPVKTALHKNCQGCHTKLKDEGKPTGPLKCKECHVK